jgi:hypothetical protein
LCTHQTLETPLITQRRIGNQLTQTCLSQISLPNQLTRERELILPTPQRCVQCSSHHLVSIPLLPIAAPPPTHTSPPARPPPSPTAVLPRRPPHPQSDQRRPPLWVHHGVTGAPPRRLPSVPQRLPGALLLDDHPTDDDARRPPEPWSSTG